MNFSLKICCQYSIHQKQFVSNNFLFSFTFLSVNKKRHVWNFSRLWFNKDKCDGDVRITLSHNYWKYNDTHNNLYLELLKYRKRNFIIGFVFR